MDNLFKSTIYSSKALFLKTALVALLALGTSFSPAHAAENTIFEGYYKVLLSNTHAGYAVQRYTFDPKKKQFESAYYVYVRLSPDGKKYSTESLTAISNEKFHPQSYQYTAIANGKPVIIDAKVKNDVLQASTNKEGKTSKKQEKVPKGAFFSTMLLHLVLQNGLQVGKSFSYKAVAEEDGSVVGGSLKVASEQKYLGQNTHKLEYKFKGIDSVAYVSDDGHVLASDAPAQSVRTELVANPQEAKGSFPFPEKTLKTIFGEIPKGTENTLAKKNKPKSSVPGPQVPTDTLRTAKSGE